MIGDRYHFRKGKSAFHIYRLAFSVCYNNKTVLLRDTVHQISRGESAAAGLTGRGLPEGDLVDRIT